MQQQLSLHGRDLPFFRQALRMSAACQIRGFNNWAEEQWHAVFPQLPDNLIDPLFAISGSQKINLDIYNVSSLPDDAKASIKLSIQTLPHDDTPQFKIIISGDRLNTGLRLQLNHCRVNPSKTGMSLKIFDRLLQLADNNEADFIQLQATETGSYVWAKMGFYPTNKHEWETLKDNLLKRCDQLGLSNEDYERILDLLHQAKFPQMIHKIAGFESVARGKLGFPLLHNETWAGVFDCQPDSLSRKIFQSYQEEYTQRGCKS